MNTKKIIIVVIVLAVVVFGYIYGSDWLEQKKRKIELGLSEPTFPYRDYSEEELAKMYPQIKYADVPTRITPEQTYAKFRQALQGNNLELAIEQLSKESEKYEENKETLTKFYNENKFQELYQHYPEKIEKSSMYESIASFYFLEKQDGNNLRQYIGFIKDGNGDWKVDSL